MSRRNRRAAIDRLASWWERKGGGGRRVLRRYGNGRYGRGY